jgi:hypothetical protein
MWEDIQVLAQCKYSKYLLARQLFSSKPFTLTRGRRRYSTSWGCKGFENISMRFCDPPQLDLLDSSKPAVKVSGFSLNAKNGIPSVRLFATAASNGVSEFADLFRLQQVSRAIMSASTHVFFT